VKWEEKMKSNEVWKTPPDTFRKGGWPAGWKKKETMHQVGKTKGRKDCFWYSPGKKRFQLMVEVEHFINALQQVEGNEKLAWKIKKHFRLVPRLGEPLSFTLPKCLYKCPRLYVQH